MSTSSPSPTRNVLIGYLTRELIGRILTTAAILLALMEILALLEQLTPILERHQGARGIAYFMMLHAPMLVGGTLPLAVLIGSLVLLVQMTTGSEIAILRAAGLTTPGLIRLMLPAILTLGVVGALVDDQITPRSELALASWWNRTDPHPETGHGFWFRAGTTLADIGYVAHGGTTVTHVDLYQRGPNGRLLRTIHLDTLRYADGTWTDNGGRSLEPTGATVRTATLSPAPALAHDWPAGIRPADMIRLSMDTPPLSATTIIAILHGRMPASQPPAVLRTALLARVLIPLSFAVMLLLALPVVYIPPRSGTRSWLPVWCLGAGLLFVVFQGMLRALGNAGTLPAPAATLPGIVIFTLAVCALVLRIEER
ncbi:YjgP/YjgQ family permease [Gluconacetobacter aggeris]|uniref:YjgP/YjgQ family permease n=1 Tax=Gluconacetobacter aggeris TaxID=1286186 RepID=A0A7W4NZZ2_9PROT|nr:LptF/LptG family permease [Gluconacetobacter aggeris]MBB2170098.1 YjgP/YjgQ family permease [Gluconacetobacter aggeris]